MSLDAFRQNCTQALQDRADLCSTQAIGITASAVTSTDQYAMHQIERLAMARAYLDAQKIILAEFKKLTQPEQKPEETEAKPARKMYG